ncbi:trimeric intracellular cation channel family protein [Stenotrophomonas acidaminiphila]|uniref:trimeric intracellular cation channel family protein n=1 Tax=Stenotrophomonas acidaminiphila TaxID=128780 RepID=UPI0039BC7210
MIPCRPSYPAITLAAGIITFFRAPLIERMQYPVRMFDAMGLALFAVAGTQKALAFGIAPPMAAALGMLTGIGGGIARDVLLAQVPLVLQAELYAVAALAGAAVVALGYWLGLQPLPCALAGAGLCFGLRMMAMHYGWHLPVALQSSDPPPPEGPRR